MGSLLQCKSPAAHKSLARNSVLPLAAQAGVTGMFNQIFSPHC